MLGPIVLFQISIIVSNPETAPQPVFAGPVDLSEVASEVHLNRKALEGWVPKKGTPGPVAPLPEFVTVYEPVPVARSVYPEEEGFADESVNAFPGPYPWFFGPPRFVPRRAHRSSGAFRRGPGRTPARAPRGATWREMR